MQAKFTVDVHADADTLEEYVVGRLPEPVSESLEEHLLICARCQKALAEIGEYVALMKYAMANLAPNPSESEPHEEPGWVISRWGGIGVAVAVLAVILSWWVIHPKTQAPETNSVQLVALRGDETASIPHTRGGLVDLTIDASDLPGIVRFQLQLVDGSGREQWRGSATPSDGKLAARVPKALGQGTYWVRLSSDSGELLREFGLRVD